MRLPGRGAGADANPLARPRGRPPGEPTDRRTGVSAYRRIGPPSYRWTTGSVDRWTDRSQHGLRIGQRWSVHTPRTGRDRPSRPDRAGAPRAPDCLLAYYLCALSRLRRCAGDARPDLCPICHMICTRRRGCEDRGGAGRRSWSRCRFISLARYGNRFSLSLPNGSFAAAISVQTLHHLPREAQRYACQTTRRLLAEGGYSLSWTGSRSTSPAWDRCMERCGSGWNGAQRSRVVGVRRTSSNACGARTIARHG